MKTNVAQMLFECGLCGRDTPRTVVSVDFCRQCTELLTLESAIQNEGREATPAEFQAAHGMLTAICATGGSTRAVVEAAPHLFRGFPQED